MSQSRLLAKLLENEITDAECKQLNRLLGDDPALRRLYRKYMTLDAMLRWEIAPPLMKVSKEERTAVDSPSPAFLPNIDAPSLDSASRPIPSSYKLPLAHSTLGGWAFSYAVATVFVGLLILGFWAYKLPSDRGSSITTNENSRGLTDPGESPHDRPALVFVGRITGTAAVKWSDDQNYLPPLGVNVRLGRQYKLKSGLMEITYDTGAKVILEGPCDYTAESTAGGYLALGKLVARVGAGGEGRGTGEVASGQWSVARVKDEGGRPNAASLAANPQSPIPNPLFAVRTPTAVVTDLGTEFGVKVSDTGETASHVFEGRVVMRTEGGSGKGEGRESENAKAEIINQTSEIILSACQSARVERDEKSGELKLHSGKQIASADHEQFARRLPRPTPIKLFNTGVGLKEGDADPHWQIVARSDQGDFQPQAAVVASVGPGFRPNEYNRSQWISIDGNLMPGVPNETTYTFRTTFDLPNALSDTAVLRGRFIADNQVVAIRLNGEEAVVPEQDQYRIFQHFFPFVMRKGFVRGINVLEVVVFNGGGIARSAVSPMALRMELEGVVFRDAFTGTDNFDKPTATTRKESFNQ